MLKTAISACALACAFTGAAQAADALEPTPQPMTPAPAEAAPNFEWSGFYAGLSVGYAQRNYEYEGDTAAFEPGYTLDPTTYRGEVVIGGNVERDTLVFGLEASAGRYRFSGEGTSDFTGILPPQMESERPFDYDSEGFTAAVAARVGKLVTPNVLLYGTAGLRALYSDAQTRMTAINPLTGESETRELEEFGSVYGTLGLGVEVAVSEKVSLDLNYQHGFSLNDMVDERITALEGLDSRSNAIQAQALFHF